MAFSEIGGVDFRGGKAWKVSPNVGHRTYWSAQSLFLRWHHASAPDSILSENLVTERSVSPSDSPTPACTAVGSLPITVLMNVGSGSNDKGDAWAAISKALMEAGRDQEILTARRPQDGPGSVAAGRNDERGCRLQPAHPSSSG